MTVTKTTAHRVGAAARKAGVRAMEQGTARVSGTFTTRTGYRAETWNREVTTGYDSRGKRRFYTVPDRVFVEVGVDRTDERRGVTVRQVEEQVVAAVEAAGFVVESVNGNGQFFVVNDPEA